MGMCADNRGSLILRHVDWGLCAGGYGDREGGRGDSLFHEQVSAGHATPGWLWTTKTDRKVVVFGSWKTLRLL